MKLTYDELIEAKKLKPVLSGFTPETELHTSLFDFQKYCTSLALKHGRYGLFEDCGLGKTFQGLVWAQQVALHTNKPVIILCPLAVVDQTIAEANRWGMLVVEAHNGCLHSLQITNYEQLDNINPDDYSGIWLDESSILKNETGAYRNRLINCFRGHQFKLCTTATPSPNDPMEIGNHAEFLGVMNYNEMLAMFFTHDGSDTSKWKLKGHAKDVFYEWMNTWSIMLSLPSDIGFSATGYDLPALNFIEKQIKTEQKNGKMFNDTAVSATNINAEFRLTILPRLECVKEIVELHKAEDILIWAKHNDEALQLKKSIINSEEISGSHSNEYKKNRILWFTKNHCICKNGIKKEIEIQQTNIIKKGCLTPILPPNGKNILKNGTEKTKIKSRNIGKGQNKSETIGAGNYIIQTPNIESDKSLLLSNGVRKIPKQELSEALNQITESQLTNTSNLESNKGTSALFVEQKAHLLIQNNDCTSIIATPPEKSEDCFASTAITESENSKTISNCLNEPLCICGNSGKVLITKIKMMGFGVNAQNCHVQIFAALDFGFEAVYQGVRRSYRFGQTEPVYAYLITTDTMANVIAIINKKIKAHKEMQKGMTKAHLKQMKTEKSDNTKPQQIQKFVTPNVELYRGNCVKLIKNIPDNSLGFSMFSPPFPTLYVYSNHPEDMANNKDYGKFKLEFEHMVNPLFDKMQAGRNVVVHCQDLPIQKGKEGFIGLRDFSGLILNTFLEAGFIYHSRVTLWKNPVIEMTRTHALGLLMAQIKKDAGMSRVGLPDYLMVFRKPGEHENPVKHQDTDQNGPNYMTVDMWQKIASPVWFDVNFSDTLNLKGTKDEEDEAHICPLSLDTTGRATLLWSNPGDLCYTPYGGIGSEPCKWVEMGRRAISNELKESYFNVACKNVKNYELGKRQLTFNI